MSSVLAISGVRIFDGEDWHGGKALLVANGIVEAIVPDDALPRSAEAVDLNFVRFVKEGHLPAPRSHTGLAEAGLSGPEFMDLLEPQMMSRQMDLRARILHTQNE